VNEPTDLTTLVLWGGFGLAFIFGVVASRTNFCTMGAVSDVVNMGHWGRMRMWMLSVAVAIIGTTALHHLGWIDITKSVYQRPTIAWLSFLFGGLLFGVGMTLSGGCVNKNLLRLGGGSLRSLVVLVFVAVSAYMSLKGLFGQWRVNALDPVSLDLASVGVNDQRLGTAVSRLTGVSTQAGVLGVSGIVALALLAFALKDKRFRANPLQVGGGVALGLLVVAAWYLTGHLGHGENPQTLETVYFGTNTRTLESLSFVAPTAYSLELLMLWTDKSLRASFGVATVMGVVLGSASHALASRSFRWEGFASLDDLRNQLLGGVLMGFGGVTAMGCTVGQGMSGLSTLALGSILAMGAIVAGAVATMKYQLWREG
jgi:uncharacterized protein